MIKKFFRALFLFLSLLIVIIAFNTINYSSKQATVDPVNTETIPDEVGKRLSEAIKIVTVSSPEQFDSSQFQQMNSFLAENYPFADSLLEKKRINTFSLVYKWPGRKPKLSPILLTAHLDVVPVEEETRHQWEIAPFSGQIKEGVIWGRGSLDDKASVLGILEAVELLLRAGYQPERSIYLAFGHDEEVSGIHGAKAIAAEFEKEGIRFEFVLDEGMVMIEDAFPGLPVPVALVGLAEKGYVSLKLEVDLMQGGHSSMPPDQTSIGILSEALTKLQNHPFPAKLEGPVRDLFDYIGPEVSYPNKIIFANLWLFKGLLKQILATSPSSNALMRTTTAPTILKSGIKENVLPAQAIAIVNFRIFPGEDIESVKQFVQQVINDQRVNLSVYKAASATDPSPVSSTNSFGFKVLERTIRQIYPEVVVAPSLMIGATDGRHYSDISGDVYRFFPVLLKKEDLSRYHGINERIETESYKKAIQFYKQLIINSCK